MDLEATYAQAVEAIGAGRHEDAQRLLNQVVKKDPRHERAWLALALIVPEMDQAIECLTHVLEINPENAEAFDYLSMARQEKKRDADARAAAGTLTEADHAGLPRLGNYLLSAKLVTPTQLQSALAAQRKADAAGRPKQLGNILIDQGVITAKQLDQAIQSQIQQFNTLFRD